MRIAFPSGRRKVLRCGQLLFPFAALLLGFSGSVQAQPEAEQVKARWQTCLREMEQARQVAEAAEAQKDAAAIQRAVAAFERVAEKANLLGNRYPEIADGTYGLPTGAGRIEHYTPDLLRAFCYFESYRLTKTAPMDESRTNVLGKIGTLFRRLKEANRSGDYRHPLVRRLAFLGEYELTRSSAQTDYTPQDARKLQKAFLRGFGKPAAPLDAVNLLAFPLDNPVSDAQRKARAKAREAALQTHLDAALRELVAYPQFVRQEKGDVLVTSLFPAKIVTEDAAKAISTAFVSPFDRAGSLRPRRVSLPVEAVRSKIRAVFAPEDAADRAAMEAALAELKQDAGQPFQMQPPGVMLLAPGKPLRAEKGLLAAGSIGFVDAQAGDTLVIRTADGEKTYPISAGVAPQDALREAVAVPKARRSQMTVSILRAGKKLVEQAYEIDGSERVSAEYVALSALKLPDKTEIQRGYLRVTDYAPPTGYTVNGKQGARAFIEARKEGERAVYLVPLYALETGVVSVRLENGEEIAARYDAKPENKELQRFSDDSLLTKNKVSLEEIHAYCLNHNQDALDRSVFRAVSDRVLQARIAKIHADFKIIEAAAGKKTAKEVKKAVDKLEEIRANLKKNLERLDKLEEVQQRFEAYVKALNGRVSAYKEKEVVQLAKDAGKEKEHAVFIEQTELARQSAAKQQAGKEMETLPVLTFEKADAGEGLTAVGVKIENGTLLGVRPGAGDSLTPAAKDRFSTLVVTDKVNFVSVQYTDGKGKEFTLVRPLPEIRAQENSTAFFRDWTTAKDEADALAQARKNGTLPPQEWLKDAAYLLAAADAEKKIQEAEKRRAIFAASRDVPAYKALKAAVQEAAGVSGGLQKMALPSETQKELETQLRPALLETAAAIRPQIQRSREGDAYLIRTFGDEIEVTLDGRPVQAQRDGGGYLLRPAQGKCRVRVNDLTGVLPDAVLLADERQAVLMPRKSIVFDALPPAGDFQTAQPGRVYLFIDSGKEYIDRIGGRVLDASGSEVARLPVRKWDGKTEVEIPPILPAGEYRVEVALYDTDDPSGSPVRARTNLRIVEPAGGMALLIACDDYDAVSPRSLPWMSNDAERLRRILREKYGYKDENIWTLYCTLNDGILINRGEKGRGGPFGRNYKAGDFSKAVEETLNRFREEVGRKNARHVVLFYGGHGTADENGQEVLLLPGDRQVPVHDWANALFAGKPDLTVIGYYSACRDKSVGRQTRLMDSEAAYYALQACEKGLSAYTDVGEKDDGFLGWRQSLFGKSLCEGLESMADRKPDEWKMLSLYGLIEARMAANYQEARQKNSQWAGGQKLPPLEGKVVLAPVFVQK